MQRVAPSDLLKGMTEANFPTLYGHVAVEAKPRAVVALETVEEKPPKFEDFDEMLDDYHQEKAPSMAEAEKVPLLKDAEEKGQSDPAVVATLAESAAPVEKDSNV